jgi:Flp pilus assembly protein TadD
MPLIAPFVDPRRLTSGLALASLIMLGACANLDQQAIVQPDRAVSTGESAPAPPATAAGVAKTPVLAEARRLRAAGEKRQALALLEKAAAQHPDDRRLAGERGLLALELGQVANAKQSLEKAIDPDAPDWRLHSALGAALATSGRQQEAQIQLAKALALAPDHPAVLNNLALSYALDGKHDEAEKLLRRASGTTAAEAARAKQNLALILGLGGRLEEARQVSQSTLSPDKASANIAYLKQQVASGPPSSRTDREPIKSAQVETREGPTYRLGAPID